MKKLLFIVFAAALMGSFPGVAYAQTYDLREVTEDGSWKVFTKDSLAIVLDVRPVKFHGKWWRVDIYMANDSDSTYRFTMDEASITSDKGRSPLLTEGNFSKKVRHRKWWKNFGAASAVLAADVAVQVGTRRAFDTGSRWSFGRELSYGLTSLAIDLAADAAIWGISNTYGDMMNRLSQENIGYLHDVTVQPRSMIRGHAIAKAHNNAGELNINLPVNGQIYVFHWGALPDEYIVPTEH